MNQSSASRSSQRSTTRPLADPPWRILAIWCAVDIAAGIALSLAYNVGTAIVWVLVGSLVALPVLWVLNVVVQATLVVVMALTSKRRHLVDVLTRLGVALEAMSTATWAHTLAIEYHAREVKRVITYAEDPALEASTTKIAETALALGQAQAVVAEITKEMP